MLACGQDFTDDLIRRIDRAVLSEPALSRRALSVKVCEWLDWRSANGKPKEMSCRLALLKLHRRGMVKLPAAAAAGVPRAARGKDEPVLEEMGPISCKLKELGEVDLVRIRSRQSKASRLWNALLERYHYLGSGPLCGAQMRYLIRSSSHGWLGAVAFSAAAWRVEARDRWVGWSDVARQRHLHKVVCNSRFLILPQVSVPNLASHVMSLCARRLPPDWLDRYGIEPVLLESFVERGKFQGTCYRAANWHCVGSTRGRGRQDRDHRHALAVKDVFVLPLEEDARRVLCGDWSEPAIRFDPTEEVEDWAEEEFGKADLGDRRLSRRLVSLARDFYSNPQANVAQACGSRAKTKAAYRFFDHPDTTMDRVLAQRNTLAVWRGIHSGRGGSAPVWM